MTVAVERQEIAISGSAHLLRYQGRIVELKCGAGGRTLFGLLASGPATLSDPARGFQLIPVDPGISGVDGFLSNAELDEGCFSLRLPEKEEAAAVRLAGGVRNPFDRSDHVAAINAAQREYARKGFILSTMFALHEDDPDLIRAWAICAAALQLDDDVVGRLIELVVPLEGDRRGLLRRLKRLPGIWKNQDETWYVAEDVRRDLLRHLYATMPVEVITRARRVLALHCDERAARFAGAHPRGQLEVYRARMARHEAAYQRTLNPEERERGIKEWCDLWGGLAGANRQSVAEAVAYLAPEVEELLGALPVELARVAESVRAA